MMNMKLLAVVTPSSIYHGWFFLEEKVTGEKKSTGEEKFTFGEFSDVNMKNLVVTMLGNT